MNSWPKPCLHYYILLIVPKTVVWAQINSKFVSMEHDPSNVCSEIFTRQRNWNDTTPEMKPDKFSQLCCWCWACLFISFFPRLCASCISCSAPVTIVWEVEAPPWLDINLRGRDHFKRNCKTKILWSIRLHRAVQGVQHDLRFLTKSNAAQFAWTVVQQLNHSQLKNTQKSYSSTHEQTCYIVMKHYNNGIIRFCGYKAINKDYPNFLESIKNLLSNSKWLMIRRQKKSDDFVLREYQEELRNLPIIQSAL